MKDPFQLARFVDAQGPVYERVVQELRAGRKASHWMWYVFPQLRGLGGSPTANHYGISSIAEAQAYLAHPVLGPRLEACVRLVLLCQGCTAEQIFGFPDVLKFRSCLTLFAAAAPGSQNFHRGAREILRRGGGPTDAGTSGRVLISAKARLVAATAGWSRPCHPRVRRR